MKFWLICHFCPVQQRACLTRFKALCSRVAAGDVFVPQGIVVIEVDQCAIHIQEHGINLIPGDHADILM